MADLKLDACQRIYCNTCGGDTHHKLKAVHSCERFIVIGEATPLAEAVFEEKRRYRLWICRECGDATFEALYIYDKMLEHDIKEVWDSELYPERVPDDSLSAFRSSLISAKRETQGNARSVVYSWTIPKIENSESVSGKLFSMEIVGGAKDYIQKIARQANGCYEKGWYDACAVMVRRLIEMLIIDSFDARGKLSDIKKVGRLSPSSQVSEQPTASEIRRFLEEDFPQLETALNDVRVSLGGSPLTGYSAPSNWKYITSRFPDIPDNISAVFGMVVETQELARGGTTKLTGKQLLSARQRINEILGFLHQRFPAAGIDLPSHGEIISLRRLIEKYLDAADTYWHIEQTARPALGKIKTIGDIGAHGRHVKVTRQSLDKYQDALIISIQQLVGTAYGK